MSKDIYVVVEQRDGAVQKVGLELLGEAGRLAAELNQRVVAVLMGSAVSEAAGSLFQYGAHEVVVVEDPILERYVTEPYAKALTQVIRQREPEIVLFGATSIGRDLAPRVASRIHTGLTADCTALAIDPEEQLLLMTRPAFGGNIMATIVCREYRPQMATVRPGVMKVNPVEPGAGGEVKRIEVYFRPEDMNVEILEVCSDGQKQVDITESAVLVSGGRGVGGPEGYGPLRELARELKAEVSASRVSVDSGWIEKGRQVGQTGKTVRPALYLALGISGALQHMAGMEDAGFILAVNKDPSAPMMAAADLGIVGDLKEIVPKLTRAIRQHKENRQA